MHIADIQTVFNLKMDTLTMDSESHFQDRLWASGVVLGDSFSDLVYEVLQLPKGVAFTSEKQKCQEDKRNAFLSFPTEEVQ